MCTVSYLPQKNGNFVFTSNRDEDVNRKTISPKMYLVEDVKVLMPKDDLAGGTWIGVSDQKRLVCLLNGGFEKHVRKNNYRHSRGKVVNDFLKTKDFLDLMKFYNLSNIEPFTLIIVDWSDDLILYELVWDETEKHISQLDVNQPRIWSSSTLYNDEMKQIRNQWFLNYFADKEFSRENALDFHKNFGVGDKEIDLQIDRGNLKTVSITNITKKEDELIMIYEDLINTNIAINEFHTELIHE